MDKKQDKTTKKNVSQFDDDVRQTGSYAYTAERLSSRLANERISDSIAKSFDFYDKTVLDLGCGDGAYSVEFAALGVEKVVGIDPASAAIEAATTRALELGLDTIMNFEVGNIYNLGSQLVSGDFDCIVLRGVLHHLPEPAGAITALGDFKGTIIILEPNGYNPVLKLLEKFSRYHIDHEEQSFSPALIRSWLKNAGFHVTRCEFLNLVPMFCPDWLAKFLSPLGSVVEHLPLLRNVSCGQCTIVARK